MSDRSCSLRTAAVVVAVPYVLLFVVLTIFGGGQTSTILSKVGAAIPDHQVVGTGVDTTSDSNPGAGGTDSGGADDGKQIADAAGAVMPALLIVRTGQLDIVVADLHATVAAADASIRAVGGYVGSSDESAAGGPA